MRISHQTRIQTENVNKTLFAALPFMGAMFLLIVFLVYVATRPKQMIE